MEIKKVGVVGCGFMGSGIAQVSAMAGLDVIVFDVKREAVDKAFRNIRRSFEKLKSKGRFSGDEEKVLAGINAVDGINGVSKCDIVIEAVHENVSLKQQIFQTLDKNVSHETILATNTSSVPMSVLADKVSHPERFIGTHFFGPVPLMALVEIVMGPVTSEETLEDVRKFVKKLEKTSIVVRKHSPGFLVNRIFNAAAGEAIRCWLEGVATPQDIDTGMKLGYGWPAGPFEVFDNAGLDVMAGIFAVLGGGLPPPLKEMLEKGHLGKKTGHGFYKYSPDGKKIQE